METSQLFFRLLRVGLGITTELDHQPSEQEWSHLYLIAQKQSLIGITYNAISKLGNTEQPPLRIAMPWAAQAETIRGLNQQMNAESTRLTTLFESNGYQTAILKGQANAILYPDTLSRQPGDIDIYVDGNPQDITDFLFQTGMIDSKPRISNMGLKDKPSKYYHHIQLPINKNGIVTEIHFRPSSGNANPFTNRRIQQYLVNEIMTTSMTHQGFRAPSIKFSLIMQLAHIQRHFLGSGLGLRQICDYYILLNNSNPTDREETKKQLRCLGLKQSAGALMWVLQQVFNIDQSIMICSPDTFRGKWLLNDIMERGNFGRYSSTRYATKPKRFIKSRLRHLKLLDFCFNEAFWIEVRYWKNIVITIPERIRRKSISLAPKN